MVANADKTVGPIQEVRESDESLAAWLLGI